jgi:hypothetical protein
MIIQPEHTTTHGRVGVHVERWLLAGNRPFFFTAKEYREILLEVAALQIAAFLYLKCSNLQCCNLQ